MKEISLDFLRASEAGAISASKWCGSGNKLEADKSATDAMRKRLNEMHFAGKIAIGEGIKDKSFGLFAGEYVGKLGAPLNSISSASSAAEMITENQAKVFEIAIDPIDGTTPLVEYGYGAISTIAVANEGCMFAPPPNEHYMLKLAYGQHIKERANLSLNDSIESIVDKIAYATGKDKNRITISVLSRPRHKTIITKLREIGVRIKLFQDGDVTAAFATCLPDSGVDAYLGIGGAPESILGAAAVKCLRGGFQSQFVYFRNKELTEWEPKGGIFHEDNLIKGDCVFVATGITDGMLKGVRCTEMGITTNSVFMRSNSHTVRWLTTNHGN